jgi:hypothetical protein
MLGHLPGQQGTPRMTSHQPSRPADPDISRNTFRSRSYEPRPIPNFSEQRARLPEPLLPGRPEWVEMYWRAWELAWSNLRRPAQGSRLVANYLSRSEDDYLSSWESSFCVLYGVYGRRAVRMLPMLDNFYARQHADGLICREIGLDEGRDLCAPFDPDGAGPNTLAWAEWLSYRMTGDDGRIGEVFWPLLAYHRWMKANRTWPDGLYWATGMSSGMTNQNRVPEGEHHHRHWTWVDANMQAAVETRCLAQMAMVLGHTDLAEPLSAEAQTLVEAINARLWDEDRGFYVDAGPDGQFSPVRSIAAYWGLLVKGLVPQERLVRFLQPLRDEQAFNRSHRAPSQAADSEDYAIPLGDFWRGGVWAPANYVLLKGLANVGHRKLAHQIAVNHLTNIGEVFVHTDTLWEYYAPDAAAPGADAQPDYVGWTGLSAIAILLEDVIGLSTDWPLRKVVWDLQYPLEESLGVRRYPLGLKDQADLVAGESGVVIDSSAPFNLTVHYQDLTIEAAVPVGQTHLPF